MFSILIFLCRIVYTFIMLLILLRRITWPLVFNHRVLPNTRLALYFNICITRLTEICSVILQCEDKCNVASQLLGLEFEPELGLQSLCVVFCMFILYCVCMGFLEVLCFAPISPKHAAWRLGYTKLPQGVNECVNVHVCVWWTSVFLLHTRSSWIGSRSTTSRTRIKHLLEDE